MHPIDGVFVKELVSLEHGGGTSTRLVARPHCGANFELRIDVGNKADQYSCCELSVD